MVEKYSDLEERIKRDRDLSLTGLDRVTYTLRWLDRNPSQVPGRTITASEFDEAVESCVTEDATVPPHTFAARLGVVCVLDPEPTNAERLTKVIREIGYDIRHNGNRSGSVALALDLDARGVKAPGGGDD